MFFPHVLRMISWRSGGGVGRRDRSGGGWEYAGKRRRVGGEAFPERKPGCGGGNDMAIAVCDRRTSTGVWQGEAERHSEGPEEPGPEGWKEADKQKSSWGISWISD